MRWWSHCRNLYVSARLSRIGKQGVRQSLRTLAKDGFDTLVFVVFVAMFEMNRMNDREPEKCCAYPSKGV